MTAMITVNVLVNVTVLVNENLNFKGLRNPFNRNQGDS